MKCRNFSICSPFRYCFWPVAAPMSAPKPISDRIRRVMSLMTPNAPTKNTASTATGIGSIRFSLSGTACNYNYRREALEWETGRTEYYLKPEKGKFTEDGRGFNPIAWPFYILGDTVCLIFHDWHLKGEGPGFWYTAAYLPPLSWLNAPFMRPPYSYREEIEYTTEEVKYPTPKLKVKRITPIIEERFDPDTSRQRDRYLLRGENNLTATERARQNIIPFFGFGNQRHFPAPCSEV